MKTIYYALIIGLLVSSCNQQSKEIKNQESSNNQSLTNQNPANLENISGAWEGKFIGPQGDTMRVVSIIADGYISTTGFNDEKGIFDGTSGGKLSLKEDQFIRTYEFHTLDTSRVGQTVSQQYQIEGNKILFPENNIEWTRLDDGTPGDLNGAWLITGRKRDGEMIRIEPDARKTMKILSGERFQWIAYNDETGYFYGTGGGSYTTEDSTYTENIEFFSRDSTRVGASLEFNYKLIDGEWHHTGLSSKGEPIYEIWTRRE